MNDSSDEITLLGAAQIARLIARGELSARAAVGAFIDRIEKVNPRLNALVVPLLDQAQAAAFAADEAQARGQPLGPLHGAPITIKESFHVAGTPSTMGLTQLKGKRIKEDGLLVQRLRGAGAIVLGKTNLPQLMIWHESDNPVYGRTNNPWDLSRTPGGSSGGEAAIIAAGGSALGLGSDLGGSLRVPAHFCGVASLKPTSRRLPRSGGVENLRGMDAMQMQPGPMARRVEDLQVALRVLCDRSLAAYSLESTPAPLVESDVISMKQMRVAYWCDDEYFPPSPAIRAAVQQAAEALSQRGVTVERFQPPNVPEAIRMYYAILGSDGGADMRRLARGSVLDRRVRRLLRIARLSNAIRPVAAAALRLCGQRYSADLLSAARPCSADAYWRLTYSMKQYTRRFIEALDRGRFDVMLFPPHALPAIPHGEALDLIPAASYSFLPNLLGIPAGVVPITTVGQGQQSDRPASGDWVLRLAKKTETLSAGLPVGVQVAARYWREDVVLAVMAALEESFQTTADYPRRPPLD